MKYMIDFDRMLLIKEGYFDSEEDALAWIEETITEENCAKTIAQWNVNFNVYKGLYKPIPLYPSGDKRLETHKYGRYSGGLR